MQLQNVANSSLCANTVDGFQGKAWKIHSEVRRSHMVLKLPIVKTIYS